MTLQAVRSLTLACLLLCVVRLRKRKRVHARASRQLRKKLGEDAADPAYLLTDSYIGYRFREP